MKWFAPCPWFVGVLLTLTLWGSPARAQSALDSGGGARGAATVRVRDALGTVAAGFASGSGTAVQSGLIPGLPPSTPVQLNRFALARIAEGVELQWEGNDERRILGFTVERAEGDLTPPPDEAFTVIKRGLRGPGPHRYVDGSVEAGKRYYYRLKAILGVGQNEYYGPWSVLLEDEPMAFLPMILPARPNPFHGDLVLELTLDRSAPVSWRLFDAQGRRVGGGAMSAMAPGFHAITIRPSRPLASGIYFLRIQAGARHEVQKVVNLPW